MPFLSIARAAFLAVAIGHTVGHAAQAQRATSARITLIGTWRITRGMVAPWVTPTDEQPDTRLLVGETMRVSAQAIEGSRLVRCARPHFQVTHMPAAGLFQGGLPKPAAKIARDVIGVTRLPVDGISLNCDAGLYEFHQVDPNTMLVALDNVIWTLDRSPGATADAASPSGVMERFLERHFAGDMGFLPEPTMAKRAFYTDALQAGMTRYFTRPSSPDEVPAIDGDPFTDSQEYPTRFSVGAGTVTGDRATVIVRFADGYRTRRMTFLLRKERGAWRMDDARYSRGPSLRALLAM